MTNFKYQLSEKEISEKIVKGMTPALIESFFKELKLKAIRMKTDYITEEMMYEVLKMIKQNNKDFFKDSKFKILQPYDIKGNMNDLIGYEDIKEELLQIKDMFEKRKLFKENGIQDIFNILLSGPAGTGKTKMVSYLAKELNIPMISGTGNVGNKYQNSGANEIKELFDKANQVAKMNNSPIIIFLDESQKLFVDRTSQQQSVNNTSNDNLMAQNELLSQLDGVNTVDGVDIIFIAASNFSDNDIKLDEAMSRRFLKKIFFRLPNKNERIEIVKSFVKKINKDLLEEELDYDNIAEMTTFMSPALIENLFKETVITAIRKEIKVNNKLILNTLEILQVGKPDIKVTENQKENQEKIARHEIGHFITSFICDLNNKINKKFNRNINIENYKENIDFLNSLNNKTEFINEVLNDIKTLKISIQPVAKINALGFHWFKQSEENLLLSKEEYEFNVISLYGGFVAERFYYGDEKVTLGFSNDLEKITKILKQMVKMGLYSNNKFYIIEDKDYISKKMDEVSSKLFNISLKIIEQEKYLEDILFEPLMKNFELDKNDIIKILKKEI